LRSRAVVAEHGTAGIKGAGEIQQQAGHWIANRRQLGVAEGRASSKKNGGIAAMRYKAIQLTLICRAESPVAP